MQKCVLLVCGNKGKEARGVDQLCVGLNAGIDGGIHAVKRLLQEHSHQEKWGFLLVDACNAFNEEGNRMWTLWMIRHEWASGPQFVFNCYRHFVILVLHTGSDLFLTILSKEGVTQDDLLAIVMYGVGLLPLICILLKAVSDMHQPWYADDAGAGRHFPKIKLCFEKLQEYTPPRNTVPQGNISLRLFKNILSVQEHNTEKAEACFKVFILKVMTGSHYLGGCIGGKAEQREWDEEKALA